MKAAADHAGRVQRDLVRQALGRGLRDEHMRLERYACPVCHAGEQDPLGLWLPLVLTDRGQLLCGACDLDPMALGHALGPLLAAHRTPVVRLDDRRKRPDIGPALDEMRRIPAPEYVRALCRVDVADRGETICCPLPGHDDSTPSFTVYPGERGVWCHGCQRGGGIVELAGLLWDQPTSGPGFAGLIADLARTLLRQEVAA